MKMISTKINIKRIICLVIALIFAVGLLSGCGEVRVDSSMNGEVLAKIGNASCSTAEAKMRLLEQRDLYEATDSELLWKRDINGETMAEYIKSAVKDEMVKYTACIVMADKLAIYLSDEETEAAYEKGVEAFNKLSKSHDLSSYGITEDTAKELYYKQAVYEMVYDYVSSDVSLDISDADTKVIKVNYVFIPYDDGYDRADELRVSVKNGEDFERTFTDAGYEPKMNQVIRKGDMTENFENVAYLLNDGELSEVVEDGKNGFYVIQCVEDYMVEESNANYNTIISDTRKEMFDEAYADFASGQKLRFNDDVWNEIDIESL